MGNFLLKKQFWICIIVKTRNFLRIDIICSKKDAHKDYRFSKMNYIVFMIFFTKKLLN